MNKKRILAVVVLVLVGAFIAKVWAMKQSTLLQDAQGDKKLKVAASIYPLYDIAQRVGGDYAEVKLVLLPGASPHTFEITPMQVKNLANSRALFVVGHGLDNWAMSLGQSVTGMETVTVDKGIALRKYDHVSYGGEGVPTAKAARLSSETEQVSVDEHELESEDHSTTEDPHYWLSALNAAQIARTMAEKMGELDGANGKHYADNAEKFITELEKKNGEWRDQLSKVENKNLVVFHGGWNYFADEFGLKVAGSFEPFPGQTPTPQYLAGLKNKIQAAQVKVIYVEPQFSKVAAQNLAKDLGVKVAILDPLGGSDGRDGFLQMMDYNIKTIAENQ